VGKETTVERLKIIQMSIFFKARNLLSGPEIPPLGTEFPPLDKISGGLNFRPFEIRLSPLQNVVVVQCFVKGSEILVWQNFRGPEFPEFLVVRIFAKSFLSGCGATCSKGPEFLAKIFRSENFRGGRNFGL
jgi:hypothetical protein